MRSKTAQPTGGSKTEPTTREYTIIEIGKGDETTPIEDTVRATNPEEALQIHLRKSGKTNPFNHTKKGTQGTHIVLGEDGERAAFTVDRWTPKPARKPPAPKGEEEPTKPFKESPAANIPHIGFVADRSREPDHQWWYAEDPQGPILWKERTPKGKRWRCRGKDGQPSHETTKEHPRKTIGPYRFTEHLTGHVIILGGETDAETAQAYAGGNHWQFCSMPGSETDPTGDLQPLDGATKITIIYDSDQAGRDGSKRLADRIIEHRYREGLPTIPIGHFAGEGETGADLKDHVESKNTIEERRQAAHQYIQQGIDGATPATNPNPLALDKSRYPKDYTHSAIANWIRKETGAHWEGHDWANHTLLYEESPTGSDREAGRWIATIAGRWIGVNTKRILGALLNEAIKETESDLRTLKERSKKGFMGRDLTQDQQEQAEALSKWLHKLNRGLESQGARNGALEELATIASRSPERFDRKQLVVGAPPKIADPTKAIIDHRRDIQTENPCCVFEIETARIRQGKKEDMITRGLSIPLPETLTMPTGEEGNPITAKDLLNVGDLTEEDTYIGNWIAEHCPRIWDFLRQIASYYPDPTNPVGQQPICDPEIVALLAETAGLCLIGQRQPFFTILLGMRGRNGKGLFMRMITEIAGETGHEDKHLLDRKQTSGHTEHLANLRGKNSIWIDEPEQRLNVQLLKLLTGGGNIAVSHKGGRQFTIPANGHIVITSNKPLALGTPNDSITKRLTGIPCEARFGAKEEGGMYPDRNPSQIYKELRPEYPAFTLLVLHLARNAIQTEQRAKSSRATQTSQRMLMIVNQVGQWLEERIDQPETTLETEKEPTDQDTIAYSELYEDYKDWAKELGRKPLTQQRFTQEFKTVAEATRQPFKADHRPYIGTENGKIQLGPRGTRGLVLKTKPRSPGSLY